MTTAIAAPRNTQTIRLREDVQQSRGIRVDKERGIIYGVKALSRHSANDGGKREYSDHALRQAAEMYNGARVNLGHPAPDQAHVDRDPKDGIGWLADTYQDGDDVRGDLHVLLTHPHGPMLLEAAERNPARFALSHNADGDVSTQGNGTRLVTNLQRVRSVDVVQKGATTPNGLFEAMDDDQDDVEENDDERDELEEDDDDGDLEGTIESILSSSLSPRAKSKAIAALFAGRDVPDGDSGADPSDPLQLKLGDPDASARDVAGRGSSIDTGEPNDKQGNVAAPRRSDRGQDLSLQGKNSGGPKPGQSPDADTYVSGTGNPRQRRGRNSGGTTPSATAYESFIESLNGRGVVRLGRVPVPASARKSARGAGLRSLLERQSADSVPPAVIPDSADEFCRMLNWR